MARSLKNKKGKNKKANKEINKEILGIIIVTMGIFALLSLHTDRTGPFGKIIKNILFYITGYGGYIIPFVVLVIGILFIINRLKIDYNKKILSISIIFLCYLIILDIKNIPYTEINLIEKIKLSVEYWKIGEGGGILGFIFSFFLLKIFGVIGTYIIIASMLIVCFLIITNTSIIDVIKTFMIKLRKLFSYSYSGLKNFVYVDNKNNNKLKKTKKGKFKNSKNRMNKKEISEKDDEIEQKIKILDYTKSNTEEVASTAVEAVDRKDINEKENLKKTKENNEDIEELEITFSNEYKNYQIPPIDLLSDVKTKTDKYEKKEILNKAKKLETTLSNFGIEANITQVSKGPTITRFELQPAPGVKVSKIVNLSNDIALSLAASGIRMEAPIPGKSAIGIEVPNDKKISVPIREVIESDEYKNISSKLPFALGKDIGGKPIIASIDKMPHLLVAGATGSGKSVCINTLITSILYKSNPEEVKLLMIDPKVVELGVYNGIPHLLIPVVTDPNKAAGALNWAVQEMTKRYKLFAKEGVRDLSSYNNKIEKTEDQDKLPLIVVVIDELSDLMMASPSEVEDSICRLAQMARAAGIHLIIATQRPSVDVITGTIKANIPSRISFSVSSQQDSRTILGMSGGEKLLGKGDMLFYPVGAAKPKRIQGAFIDEKEVESIVDFLKQQYNVDYKEEVINDIEKDVNLDTDNSDELLPKAIDIVISDQQASISMLQRKLRIGYNRAARIIDEMEERGIVGGHEGSKPRRVLVTEDELEG
ncbi:DNA translocase FtsK 4TM domain-containing protein [Dethiothermospora halolimnae]|uniref:FtsK/SpoIIIE family DNA translocase n=1 Tax=Dethiothermospora halolimnae TaxID=3114390 RepID=UPI003CCBB46F